MDGELAMVGYGNQIAVLARVVRINAAPQMNAGTVPEPDGTMPEL
ncbi:hypothetical protein BIFGAL_02864 [Bifidobacterium gallicum DSM 20093 = LMG 11596]|uniref:Uncharacterized protein n=1 Tax=Bifidobacterium gallicum DSM 20093 = LMG 11596 TaxID=561180 RepID=D1NSV4_9BIFI|nr:hypothetical protein BIFGAL_02864 [Bifidobacterium gallicum DSM 20093 = LMG 11596]